MRRSLAAAMLAAPLLGALAVPVASADPGAANPNVQYRTLTCSDGNTYAAGFVGFSSGNFFIVGSTSVYALKSLTLIYPSGEQQTFNYGLPGFDPSQLVTCWYTDPRGVLTIGQGFFTPRS